MAAIQPLSPFYRSSKFVGSTIVPARILPRPRRVTRSTMASPSGSSRSSKIPEFLAGSGGRPVPALGIGTASFPFVAEDVKNAVLAALEIGYRHLDTASVYPSEHLVGEAVAEAARRGVIASREEVFVTTKVWCTQCHPDLVLPSLKESLQLSRLWVHSLDFTFQFY
uniref:NADP-dependent oxidoreductase domain-containing protein n=1 Tax=Triticum aestivum TaxID=4565 RepID=A0A3B6DHY2_WHEAT